MTDTMRGRAIATLMCSMAFSLMLGILTTVPVQASTCCQTCEAQDVVCPAGCQEPDRCGDDQECLAQCYDSCRQLSDSCWGFQGNGQPFCTYCTNWEETVITCEYYYIGAYLVRTCF